MAITTAFNNPKKLLMGIVFVFVALVVINTVSNRVEALGKIQQGF